MSQTIVPKGLGNEAQAILIVLGFVLLAVQGYLQQSPLIASHPYLAILLALLPGLILLTKQLAGSLPQAGVLTPSQEYGLIFLAVILTAVGGTISQMTLNPSYLLVGGLLGAVAAGIKEFLGAAGVKVPAQ